MQVRNRHRLTRELTENSLALILAGGNGTRLKHLTRWHAKPAIPFGGTFRTIDFSLSNCMHSGIRRIGILTQYKSYSLNRHIQRGWNFLNNGMGEFIDLLPAQKRLGEGWYSGTADAIYQNLDIIEEHAPQFVVVLAGDHVYKMDYGDLLEQHVASGADMTVGCVPVDVKSARGLGVMAVDRQNRVFAFEEKPEHPRPMPGDSSQALASMGIYVFNTEFLRTQLIRDARDPHSNHDFGKDIIPRLVDQCTIHAYAFTDDNGEPGYWRDVGTVDHYWQANMELLGRTPALDLHDRYWPIWTYQEQLPPAKFLFDAQRGCQGLSVNSIVSNGCLLDGASVRNSILFNDVTADTGTVISDSLILPGARVGKDCRLNRVIVDQRCVIPDGTTIGVDPHLDAIRYHLSTGGITLVSDAGQTSNQGRDRQRITAVA